MIFMEANLDKGMCYLTIPLDFPDINLGSS